MALVPSIAALFSRFSKWSSNWSDEDNAAHALGRLGEKLAARYLRRNGYKVLYRNFRHRRGGEVDIVCRDRRSGELVFVEVKARRTRDYGSPSHAVDGEKRHLIARGAMAWLRMLDWPDIRYRFDIVEVVVDRGAEPEITIVENAFTLPEPFRT
jgi:putative endonuclease